MEDSANRAIIIGVYLFIFVSAVSLSVFLIMEVNNYSESAFYYGKNTFNVIKVDYTEDFNIVSSSQVISYYYANIEFDKYSDVKKPTTEYRFVDEVGNQINIDNITLTNKYILKYKKEEGNIKTIELTKLKN